MFFFIVYLSMPEYKLQESKIFCFIPLYIPTIWSMQYVYQSDDSYIP